MSESSEKISLFRYRSVSEGALAEIAEGYGWYAHYQTLNDPYEGVYVKGVKSSVMDNLISTLRVVCFSRTNSNHLMWAHYAANHFGVCLEYQFDQETFKTQCLPVNYSDTLPVIDVLERYPVGTPAAGSLSISIDKEAKAFLTKNSEWSYEQEVRIIRVSEDPYSPGEWSPLPVPLAGVYFGLRASRQVKFIVNKILHDRPEVPFYQANLTDGHFDLTFSQVNRDEIKKGEVPKVKK